MELPFAECIGHSVRRGSDCGFVDAYKLSCTLVSDNNVKRDRVISSEESASHGCGERKACRFGIFRSKERIVRILLAQFAEQSLREGILFSRSAAKARIILANGRR